MQVYRWFVSVHRRVGLSAHCSEGAALHCFDKSFRTSGAITLPMTLPDPVSFNADQLSMFYHIDWDPNADHYPITHNCMGLVRPPSPLFALLIFVIVRFILAVLIAVCFRRARLRCRMRPAKRSSKGGFIQPSQTQLLNQCETIPAPIGRFPTVCFQQLLSLNLFDSLKNGRVLKTFFLV